MLKGLELNELAQLEFELKAVKNWCCMVSVCLFVGGETIDSVKR